MAKKFCPKCGTERQGNEKFCRKCGYQFAEAASTVKQPAKVQPQRRSRPAPKPRKPMSKKQKAGLIGIGVVIVALIAFFV